jgi:pimeloyl-ACP methyl ester carboxylesterase
MAWNQGPDAYVKQARAMQRRRDQQPILGQIEQPTWVICGAEDSLLPVIRHEFIAQMIPNATLKVVDGAGHLPTLEQPDQMNDILRAFLRA